MSGSASKESPERPTWTLKEPPGGFAPPWPLALELAEAMPTRSWTLVGGLMVQLHAFHAGMIPQRSTTDVDIVLHIETTMSWARTTRTLHQCGYRLQAPNNPKSPSHRFVRDGDVIDVLIADHVAPMALAMRAPGKKLVQIPGGTSALRKTVNCHITREDGFEVVISVPDVLGALTLKGGAYQEDSRDTDRHLEDAVVLLSTIADADELVENHQAWTHNDPRRIKVLARNLPADHPAWGLLPQRQRARAQQSLKILTEARFGSLQD